MPNNDILGTETYATGATILQREAEDCQDFPSSCVDEENLLQDPENKWRITTSGIQPVYLNEGTPYYYGQDIDVEAVWLWKVKEIIWCNDGGTGHNLLKDHVTISGGELGDESGIDAEGNKYRFFAPDGGNVEYEVINGQIGNKREILISYGTGTKIYTFIGWASQVPALYSLESNPFGWDSLYLTYNQCLRQELFSANYLKKEYAAFIEGDSVHVTITTNQDKLNNTESCKYSFVVNGNDRSRQFNSYPTILANPAITFGPERLGDYFYCEIPTEIQTVGAYQFIGWYYGHWSNSSTGPSDADYMTRYSRTPNINIVSSEIILTAIYLESADRYTITYHRGI